MATQTTHPSSVPATPADLSRPRNSREPSSNPAGVTSAKKEDLSSCRLTVPSMTSAPNRCETIWGLPAGPSRTRGRVASECWVRVDSETDRIGDIGVFLVGDRSGLACPGWAPE